MEEKNQTMSYEQFPRRKGVEPLQETKRPVEDILDDANQDAQSICKGLKIITTETFDTEGKKCLTVKFDQKKLGGEEQAQQLKEYLNDKIDGEPRPACIVLDFSDVENLYPEILGKLIVVKKRAKTNGVRVIFHDIIPEIMEVFEITKLDRIFEFSSSPTEGKEGIPTPETPEK